ncbi:MAG TPA: peptidoglycan DD-metalloendopeptidase family protein [Atribacter sp.]|jgi:septal ring factor EnvC (AmiA/AmiB activator)|uniref:murein hydrolase activator EnvC family protein n=1 Tax=Atribacter sp. TaxID=2847780 RepID=UPI001757CD70|nr:peptidoglycan DD-metalloendopeptidase family protein [Atribacter sp.]MDD3714654.1 peptidoglycan DD-metalloendopeptidase family protein [Atribacterota bacterium]MDI9593804.1 peptidoglycan DD-metalloendopeptidase family protein [Atribacterota bacterium]HHT10350.1 peptidoglycan DD-metalloendopeptidase family protein [Candidatus Atribacteria bacterium]HQK82504.1 peptidoglycan DD-metalloendopeptidase family protein [Atribacter sp.]
MRKHSFLIIVSIILINFLFLNITDSLGSDIESEINAQLKELEKMKSEQAKLDQELKKLEKTQKNIAAEIQNIENKIEKLEKDITTSRNRILQLEKDRAHLRKDIEGLSQDISSSKTKISQAMVRAYKNNVNFDFWSVFLGSSDPSEVEEQWYLFQKYSDHEMSNISKYLNKRQNLQNKLKEIEQKIRLEAVLKEKLVLEEKNVKKLEETRKTLLNQLLVDKKKFQSSLSELLAAQKNVTNLISQMQKELKKSRESTSASTKNLPPVKMGRFFWPVSGGKVIKNFGMSKDPVYQIQVFNPGIDIATSRGDNVYAAQDGVVLLARSIRGYGKTILIDHGQDVVTMYAYLDSIKVNPGDMVKGGQMIGLVGETGLTNVPAVHFEVRVGANAQEDNPLKWLK